MADNHHLIVAILTKYALGEPLTEEETRMLREWMAKSEENRRMPDQLRDPLWREQHRRELQQAPTERMWVNIHEHIREIKKHDPVFKRRRVIRRIELAGITSVVLLVGVWLYSSHNENPREVAGRVKKGPLVATAVPSDEYRAVMIRDDGRRLDLDSVPVGSEVAMEGGRKATKTDTNTILYTLSSQDHQGRPQTDERPTHCLRVGQKAKRPYRIIYDDASMVWVHSGSRLTYPVTGLRDTQRVSMNGSVFFDVAKDKDRRPLIIHTEKGVNVMDLSTSFTVTSYANEPQTRVEMYAGKVLVNSGGKSKPVRQGYVALVNNGGTPEVSRMSEAIGMPDWIRPPAKSPYFEFTDVPFADALKEVAGWYRMHIATPRGAVKGIPLGGPLSRKLTVDSALARLQIVESSHVILERKADTIFVLPGEMESHTGSMNGP